MMKKVKQHKYIQFDDIVLKREKKFIFKKYDGFNDKEIILTQYVLRFNENTKHFNSKWKYYLSLDRKEGIEYFFKPGMTVLIQVEEGIIVDYGYNISLTYNPDIEIKRIEESWLKENHF